MRRDIIRVRGLLTVFAAGLLFAGTTVCFADEEKEEQEELVTLDQVPAAVRATLKRESAGGKIVEIEKETEDGKVVYEAEVILDGKEYEVKVAPDGTLLVKKLDADEDADEDDGDEAGEKEENERPEKGETVFSFDKGATGSVPRGWKVAETQGQGKPATWQVIRDSSAPSKPNAVAITKNPNYGRTFNLLIAKKTSYKDLTIKVRVKAIAGKEDQGGGPIWRARDADNYYIARWNPLEDNFRLYYVKGGRRRQLASADMKVDTTKWHTIEIKHRGDTIQAKFDGQKVIEIRDKTFSDAGMVGLWVKADGLTRFDDLKVALDDKG